MKSKTSLSLLRRLIREEIKLGTCKKCGKRVQFDSGGLIDFHNVPGDRFNTCPGSKNQSESKLVENQGWKETTPEEIEALPADYVATEDWIDKDTGEVYLEPGQRAGDLSFHPAYKDPRMLANEKAKSCTNKQLIAAITTLENLENEEDGSFTSDHSEQLKAYHREAARRGLKFDNDDESSLGVDDENELDNPHVKLQSMIEAFVENTDIDDYKSMGGGEAELHDLAESFLQPIMIGRFLQTV